MQESPAQTVAAAVKTTAARPKQRRGFAAMAPETLRAICSEGGRIAHAKGRAHRFTAENASQAGKKGGATVSANRSHMAEIGSRGGIAKRGYRKRRAELRPAKAEQAPTA